MKQKNIIAELEEMDGSEASFCNDAWGVYSHDNNPQNLESGGRTRVIQGGDVIEKGACSLTLIRNGVLSEERAATIRGRQQQQSSEDVVPIIQGGDSYNAAALSIVLHSRSPFVPTFRSDVRIFWVNTNNSKESTSGSLIWFGGGADLTPYYLDEGDISSFHRVYSDLAESYPDLAEQGFTYQSMKKSCDEYFYLPARSEHRGTGGIFFDDLEASSSSILDFVKNVANAWVPSWKPIVNKHRDAAFTDQQRQWQLLRRGRYLEFNLLYDRGVKFGLASANPRVEGVMVSAPPLIAWEYCHDIGEGSPEAKIMEVLKQPRDWL